MWEAQVVAAKRSPNTEAEAAFMPQRASDRYKNSGVQSVTVANTLLARSVTE